MVISRDDAAECSSDYKATVSHITFLLFLHMSNLNLPIGYSAIGHLAESQLTGMLLKNKQVGYIQCVILFTKELII